MMVQSDYVDGVESSYGYTSYGNPLYAWPRPNHQRTMWTTEKFSRFVWAEYINYILPIGGFPGFTANGQELALWTAEYIEYMGHPDTTLLCAP